MRPKDNRNQAAAARDANVLQSLGEESRGETESELMILKLGDCGLRWPRTPSEAAVRERCSV